MMRAEMLLSDIVQGDAADGLSVPALKISGVTDDSRRVSPGDLFFAVRGETVDGRDFIDSALTDGAAAIVCDAPYSRQTTIPIVPVKALATRVGELAARYYGYPGQQMTVVGVTGTNGKTSFTQLLASALITGGESCGVIGTMGHGKPGDLREPGLTTPPALDMQRRLAELNDMGCGTVVLEASSHGIVQHRLVASGIDIAVLTNITHDHLDYHGSFAAYQAAKEKLFHLPALSRAVVNIDDGFAEALISRLPADVDVVTYSARQSADVSLHKATMDESGIAISCQCADQFLSIQLPLLGAFNVENVLAVIATLHAMSWNAEKIIAGLAGVSPVAGRMEVIRQVGQPTAIIDYAHTPDAMSKALEAVRQHFSDATVYCVFGCGGDRDRSKRPLMGAVAERLADQVLLTSDNPRSENPEDIVNQIADGLSRTPIIELDRRQAIERALNTAGPSDVVLIAGKGHEDYQETKTGRVHFSDTEIVETWLHAVAVKHGEEA